MGYRTIVNGLENWTKKDWTDLAARRAQEKIEDLEEAAAAASKGLFKKIFEFLLG